MKPVRAKIGSVVLLSLFSAACLLGCGGDETEGVRPFLPLESEHRLHAVCYGPHRDGQRPGGAGPSAEELAEDLELMSPHWQLLRVYGATEITETLLSLIQDSGAEMRVMLGVWIAPDAEASNRREMEEAIRLASAYPDVVVAVCVGNETQVSWSGHRVPLEELIGYVRELRPRVSVPVTVADDFNFWNKPESQALAEELDFITFHAHPMWNGIQIEGALPWLVERLAELRALHPDRTLVIGETGWATSVIDEGEQGELIQGRAGEPEQEIYYDAVRDWSEAEGQLVFFFEAFDENWKGGANPAEVEKHWGLFRADRSPKAAIASE